VESGCYVAVVHEAHSTSSCGAGIDKFVRGTDETETSKSILKTDMDGASSPAFQYKRKTLSQNEKRNCRVMKRGKKKKRSVGGGYHDATNTNPIHTRKSQAQLLPSISPTLKHQDVVAKGRCPLRTRTCATNLRPTRSLAQEPAQIAPYRDH
jgi:hypothetical protein